MNKGTLKDLSDPEAPKHTYEYTVADNWKPELAYPIVKVWNGALHSFEVANNEVLHTGIHFSTIHSNSNILR